MDSTPIFTELTEVPKYKLKLVCILVIRDNKRQGFVFNGGFAIGDPATGDESFTDTDPVIESPIFRVIDGLLHVVYTNLLVVGVFGFWRVG